MRALFLDVLVALPIREHGAGCGRGHVAEHVRVAHDELVVNALGDLGKVEQALLLGEGRMEHHLAEHVPELFGNVLGHGGAPAGSSPRSSIASIAS